MHDVSAFDRFAWLYDVLMPSADPAPLRRGMATADGAVETVLDVGGGSGRAGVAIEPDPIVIDASRGMLRRARGKDLGVLQADAAGLPVTGRTVDAVTIVDALHHFPDARAALREAFRVLRPGGVLIIREFDPGTLRGRLIQFGERLVRFGSTFYRPEELRRMAQEAGFEVSVADRGFTYTLIARVPRPERTGAGTTQTGA